VPVFIDDPDAFDKIVAVEGEEYRKCKSEDEFWDCSFDAFYKAWRKANPGPLWWIRLKRKLCLRRPPFDMGIQTPSGNGAIYGLYGWNRYTVRHSGKILFIRGLSRSEEDAKRAQEVGFGLF
jgi:hypothetical protein